MGESPRERSLSPLKDRSRTRCLSPPQERLRTRSLSPPQERSRTRSLSPPQDKSRSRSRSRLRSRSGSPSLPRPRHRSRSRSHGRSRSRSRGRDETVNPGNTLYVTGLSYRVAQTDLEEHFSKEGKVKSCFLVMEPHTRVSRGFGFVTMEFLEDADRCIKCLNQSVLEGRCITVKRNTLRQLCWQRSNDDQFIHFNLSETSLINGQLKQLIKCI